MGSQVPPYPPTNYAGMGSNAPSSFISCPLCGSVEFDVEREDEDLSKDGGAKPGFWWWLLVGWWWVFLKLICFQLPRRFVRWLLKDKLPAEKRPATKARCRRCGCEWEF